MRQQNYMDKRIYIKDWLDFKPYEKQTKTDSYYLKLCNEVKKAITSNKQSLILQNFLDNEEISLLSCFLTSYFEDLISETNIWNSFVSIHQRLYGKKLPFYALDDYYEEEINPQDISFLIWYFLNTVQEKKIISPYSDFIVETAVKVMEVFDNEWEFAPENDYLKSFYRIDQKQNDFYIARNLIDTILFKTYLFFPDTFFTLREQEIELINEHRNNKNIMMFLNDNRDRLLHKLNTKLLSLKGKEWVAEILGANHLLSKEYLNISKKIQGFFLYKGQDDTNIFIEHIASDKKFNLTKKSFDPAHTLQDIDAILYLGITMWKEEWWFSGVFFQQPFDADLILNEKNSLESRMAVNFLDHQKKETKEGLNAQFLAFLDFNNGSAIAFLPSDSIEKFNTAYMEFFNASLNLSEAEKEAARQRARNDGFFSTNETQIDFSELSESGLIFFNPNSGVEIAMAVNSAFPMPSNPYFNAADSEEHIIRLLMDEGLSTELAKYCIDNCKTNLNFFTKGIGSFYLDDIDFLLRFWKKENYFSIPSITYIGNND
jgi:hypothetical protein